MHRYALTIFLGVLAALVVVAPAAADAPIVQTVTKKVPVREGTVTESKAFCPRNMAAVSGAVVSHPAGSTLRRSLPSGARSWRFAFGGYIGATKRSATVMLRCVGLNVPDAAGKVQLNVNTVSRTLSTGAIGRAERTVSCRRGYVPTDWGFNIPPPNTTQNVLPAEELQVFKALAGSRGYSFGIENLGAGDQGAGLRVRCLQRTVAGRAGLSHSWRIRRVRNSDGIRGGNRVVGHSCRAGHLSVGRGQSIDPAGDVVFRRSFPRRTRSARWLFDNAGGRDTVTTQIQCLSMGTDFR